MDAPITASNAFGIWEGDDRRLDYSLGILCLNQGKHPVVVSIEQRLRLLPGSRF